MRGERRDDATNDEGPGMREGTGVAAWCQPFRVTDATDVLPVASRARYCCISAGRNVRTLQSSPRTALAVQRRHEMPQLDGRKFPEALLNLALRGLEENPARGAAAPPPHSIPAPARRTHRAVVLHLDEPRP